MSEFKPLTDNNDAINHFYAARIYYSLTDDRNQNPEKTFNHFSLSAETNADFLQAFDLARQFISESYGGT